MLACKHRNLKFTGHALTKIYRMEVSINIRLVKIATTKNGWSDGNACAACMLQTSGIADRLSGQFQYPSFSL